LYEIDPHESFVWIGAVAALMVVASFARMAACQARERCEPNRRAED
jgi:hypothetical protein